MYSKRKYYRIIELGTAIFLIFAVLSSLVSYLLNFDFIISNTTPEENIGYLFESIDSQKLSAISWTTAGVLSLLFSTFFLLVFRHRNTWLTIISSILMLFIAFTFFTTGMLGFDIVKIVATHSENGTNPDTLPALHILNDVRDINTLHSFGISALGLFGIAFSVISLYVQAIPKLGSVFLVISGPLIIAFTWLDPEHILLTTGLALTWAGLLIIGSRMLTKGLVEKTTDNS